MFDDYSRPDQGESLTDFNQFNDMTNGLGRLVEAGVESWKEIHAVMNMGEPGPLVLVGFTINDNGSFTIPAGNVELTPERLGYIADTLHEIARRERHDT